MGEVVAHRSEEQAGETPAASRAHDKKFCVLGGGEQRDRCVAQREDAIDLRDPGRVCRVDELIERLASVLRASCSKSDMSKAGPAYG